MGSSLSTRIEYLLDRATIARFVLTSFLAMAFASQAVADKNALTERSGEEPPVHEAPPKIGSRPLVEPAPGIAPPFVLNPEAPKSEESLGEQEDSEQVESLDEGSSQFDSLEICPADTLWLRGEFGRARFSVEVADTRQARAKGLMHVEYMPSSKGMLFVYDHPQEVAFWMKNTLIPLDIIYADERGVVTSIQANAIPGDQTPLPGEGLNQYVLEINGGLAAMLGIEPGNEIQHPAILAPIWRCE